MRVGDRVELLIERSNVARGARGTVVDLTRSGCHVALDGGADYTTDVLALGRLDVWLIEPAARALDFHEWLQEWHALMVHHPPVPPIDLDACTTCGAPDGWPDMLRELRAEVVVLRRAVDELRQRAPALVELSRGDDVLATYEP